jgi:DNA-binding response OmpR family regulator
MDKILVIDDEANITRLVRDYLEQAGYRVLVASNAETGLH